MTCLSGPVSRLTAGSPGQRRRSGPATSGVCVRGAAGPGQSLPLTGPARGVAPVPGGQGASYWLLPGGRRGPSAAALARGARRPHQGHRRLAACPQTWPAVPPASAAARGRRPDASARAWHRPGSACARTVSPLMPAAGSGRDAIHGPAPDDRPAPRSRATGPPAWYRRSRHLRFHRHGQDLAGLLRASPELPAWRGGTGAGGLPVPPAGSR